MCGTSVSVYAFRNAASAKKPTAQPSKDAIQPVRARRVTGSGLPSAPRSHCHQPQTDAAMNTPCRPASPYRRASKNTTPYVADDTTAKNQPQ